MRPIQSLLNKAFSLMAITGLLLAAYGLMATPDEMQSSPQLPRLTARLSPASTSQSPLDTN
jgi:hypothetical protein